jgi:hypothetical protein
MILIFLLSFVYLSSGENIFLHPNDVYTVKCEFANVNFSHWVKNNKIFDPVYSRHKFIDNKDFIIDPVTYDDYGIYYCVNKDDNSSNVINITIWSFSEVKSHDDLENRTRIDFNMIVKSHDTNICIKCYKNDLKINVVVSYIPRRVNDENYNFTFHIYQYPGTNSTCLIRLGQDYDTNYEIEFIKEFNSLIEDKFTSFPFTVQQKFTLAQNENQSGTNLKKWSIVGLSIACIIIGCVIICCQLCRRKKNSIIL